MPGKVLLGSTAAAISGISRPIFAFFIITVAMAYLETDVERIVGKYSIILFLVGFVTFFSNIFQHYIYGLVGERAMNSLREALFSGMTHEHKVSGLSRVAFSTVYGRSLS